MNTDCTGCNACILRCPKHCITIKKNFEGFSYPEIDENKCIHCNICKKVCHLSYGLRKGKNSELYAFVSHNMKFVKESSSGGFFPSVASRFLKEGGIIAATYMDDNFEVKFGICRTVLELSRFCGSKYVQSETNNIYSQVENELKKEIKVLFVGTPCQIAGLKHFLFNEYPNLYTIDIICHGTPSQLYFHKYLDYLQKKLGTIKKFTFRDKSGYGLRCISSCSYIKNLSIKNKVLYNPHYNYYYFYMHADSFRECCYKCKYTNLTRISDITIGDYWGIEKEAIKINPKNGVSAVLINTQKGKELFKLIHSKGEISKGSIKKFKAINTALLTPIQRKDSRNTLYKDLTSNDFYYLIKTRYRVSTKQLIKGYIKAIIPSRLFFHIKKHV